MVIPLLHGCGLNEPLVTTVTSGNKRSSFDKNLILSPQCSKFRVHPAPGVHILAAVCTHFEICAPGVCMIFLNFKQVLFIQPVIYSDQPPTHKQIAGRT